MDQCLELDDILSSISASIKGSLPETRKLASFSSEHKAPAELRPGFILSSTGFYFDLRSARQRFP